MDRPSCMRFVVRKWAWAACLLMIVACEGSESAMAVDAGAADAGAAGADGLCDLSIEFRCGDGTCFSPEQLCDGIMDCANKRDEADCEAGCESGQVSCDNGDCIQLDQVCDDLVHCDDGSDERNCAKPMCAGLPTIVGGYQGPVLFTRQQFAQCQALCGEIDACYNDANCPGMGSFNECLRQEALSCSASAGGACRVDYESFACCSGESCADDEACVQTGCAFEAAVLKACLPKDYDCVRTASDLCFAF